MVKSYIVIGIIVIVIIAVALIATSALLLRAKKQYNDLQDKLDTLNSKRVASENALSEANATLEHANAERETAEATIKRLEAKLNEALAARHVDLGAASASAEAAQEELDKTDAAIERLNKESACIRRILTPPEVPGIVSGAIAVVGLDKDGHVLSAEWFKSLNQRSWNRVFEELGRLIDDHNIGNNVAARFMVLTDWNIYCQISGDLDKREKLTKELDKSKVGVGEYTIIAAKKVAEALNKRNKEIAAEIEALYKARIALEEEFADLVASMIAS